MDDRGNYRQKLNQKLSSKGRSTVLLMDNTGCHPQEIKDKYSNMKIISLPSNTTCKLQPLDLGIIQNLKMHYRKYFLRFVVSKIDKCETASEVIKSITILQAIRWVAHACEAVKEDTISKCFRKAGNLENVVSREHEHQDLFDELESGVFGGIEKELSINSTCPLFSQGICKLDDDLPTCSKEVSETREEESIGSDEPSLEEEEPDSVTYDCLQESQVMVELYSHLKMHSLS